MWAVAFRTANTRNQNTNAAIEGYHNAIKLILSVTKAMLSGRRIDWLLWALTNKVLPKAQDKWIVKQVNLA